jgi:hypothetical protein
MDGRARTAPVAAEHEWTIAVDGQPDRRARVGPVRLNKIFKDFSGNFSVTLNVLVIPVTQAFRIRTMLFPYVTEHADEA